MLVADSKIEFPNLSYWLAGSPKRYHNLGLNARLQVSPGPQGRVKLSNLSQYVCGWIVGNQSSIHKGAGSIKVERGCRGGSGYLPDWYWGHLKTK